MADQLDHGCGLQVDGSLRSGACASTVLTCGFTSGERMLSRRREIGRPIRFALYSKRNTKAGTEIRVPGEKSRIQIRELIHRNRGGRGLGAEDGSFARGDQSRQRSILSDDSLCGRGLGFCPLRSKTSSICPACGEKSRKNVRNFRFRFQVSRRIPELHSRYHPPMAGNKRFRVSPADFTRFP
jgi:hypothetical protein